MITASEDDGKVSASRPGIGEMHSRRLVNEFGKKMTLQNSVFSMAFGFVDHTGDLAPGEGTAWRDPDMPTVWQGRSGIVGQVAWNG